MFRQWQDRTGPFEGRGTFGGRLGELSLFEEIDAPKFEAAFSRLQSFASSYPNYIYALTMGLGKTILMATCIFYEFLFANKYPKDARFCHNALVFAPDKTVLQSLKEIQTFDKSKVVPPAYVAWLDSHLKFHYLDDTSLSLQVLENSDFNVVISNNQKIILKKSHKEKTAVDSLFAAEKKYEPVHATGAEDPFAGLDDLTDGIETEEDLIANQRFVRAVLTDFWKKYGGRRVEGMLPKLAIFASDIAELDGQLRPAVEDVLGELGIPLDSILVNVGDDKLTTNDDLREFIRLDTPESEKQFILLVNKGKEGWNCRSLFGVALHRTPKSRVFVLQATMRCLRAIGSVQETGTVYLSEDNREILAEELENNFRLNLDEFTSAGATGTKRVAVRMVPPPVTVKLKRIVKRYELRELALRSGIDFRLAEVDPAKYDVVQTRTSIDRLGQETGVKKVLDGVKENVEYSALTLTAEVARYVGKSCLSVREALESSKEGIDALVDAVNKGMSSERRSVGTPSRSSRRTTIPPATRHRATKT